MRSLSGEDDGWWWRSGLLERVRWNGVRYVRQIDVHTLGRKYLRRPRREPVPWTVIGIKPGNSTLVGYLGMYIPTSSKSDTLNLVDAVRTLLIQSLFFL